MSEPKITLQKVIEHARAQQTTPEFELAFVEFLELSDAEQKRLLFQQLVCAHSRIDWLEKKLQSPYR